MRFSPSEYLEFQKDRGQQIESWLSLLALGEGMTFADIGSGPGYACILAAGRVGPQGKVYAVDLSEEMTEFAGRLAASEGYPQIKVLQADASRELPIDVLLDGVLIANMLHHSQQAYDIITQAGRLLKPEGRLLVVEFDPEGEAPYGPPRHMRLPAERVQAWLEQAGLRITEQGKTKPDWYYLLASPASGSA